MEQFQITLLVMPFFSKEIVSQLMQKADIPKPILSTRTTTPNQERRHTAVGTTASFLSSSSTTTTTTDDESDGLVPGVESAVLAWLVGQGFEWGERRREKVFHDINKNVGGLWMDPMA